MFIAFVSLQKYENILLSRPMAVADIKMH
jgi:hypothetical protein